MITKENLSGLIILCNPDGVICEVLHDSLKVGLETESFQLLRNLASPPETVERLLASLNSATEKILSVGPVELNLEPGQYHLTGIPGETRHAILITNAIPKDLTSVREVELALVRAWLVEANNSKIQSFREQTLLNEISSLNNQLVTSQRNLIKANQELQSLAALKSRFLSIASHDLISPLSSIIGFTNILLEEQLPPQEAQEYLNIVASSAEYMMNLVQNFLDNSAIEAGKLILNFQLGDFNGIVSSVVKKHQLAAQAKSLEFAIETESIPSFYLDQARLIQVLNNLVGNSIKFSYPESTVTLRTFQQDSFAVVMVRNEGQGIPEHLQAAIFNPFSTTVTKSTGKEKSTGLGLMIVNNLVSALGGRIELDSKPDAYTCFYVYLPIKILPA